MVNVQRRSKDTSPRVFVVVPLVVLGVAKSVKPVQRQELTLIRNYVLEGLDLPNVRILTNASNFLACVSTVDVRIPSVVTVAGAIKDLLWTNMASNVTVSILKVICYQ